MLTAALLTTAKIWKQSKYPLMDRQIKDIHTHTYIYTQWNSIQP